MLAAAMTVQSVALIGALCDVVSHQTLEHQNIRTSEHHNCASNQIITEQILGGRHTPAAGPFSVRDRTIPLNFLLIPTSGRGRTSQAHLRPAAGPGQVGSGTKLPVHCVQCSTLSTHCTPLTGGGTSRNFTFINFSFHYNQKHVT